MLHAFACAGKFRFTAARPLDLCFPAFERVCHCRRRFRRDLLCVDEQSAGRERFADRRDLVLLRIDAARLSHPVHFEAADGDHFPHLYGELEASAVLDARLLSVSIDGDAALQ